MIRKDCDCYGCVTQRKRCIYEHKRRDPSSTVKSQGALRTKPHVDQRKTLPRKAKHKGDTSEPR